MELDADSKCLKSREFGQKSEVADVHVMPQYSSGTMFYLPFYF